MNISYVLILFFYVAPTLQATNHPKRLIQGTTTASHSLKKNIPSEIIKTVRQEMAPVFDYEKAFSIEYDYRAFKTVKRKSSARYAVPSQGWLTLQNVILKSNMRRNYKKNLISFNKPYNMHKKLAQPLALSELLWHHPTHPYTTLTLLQHIVDAQGYSILPPEIAVQIVDYAYGDSHVLKNAVTHSTLSPCMYIPATHIFNTMNAIDYRDVKAVTHTEKKNFFINYCPIPLSLVPLFNAHYISRRACLPEAASLA